MNGLILPVLIPLLAAPLIVLVGGAQRAWLLALLAAAAGLAATLWLLLLPDASHAVGGWSPPVGIELALDGANRPILLLVMLAAVLSLLAAPPRSLPQLPEPRLALFYALFCLCLTGLAGISISGDAFNIFVFLEISSLATYALVACGPRREALRAAFQYLILGTIGGSFVLLGVGLLYLATGSLNLADISQRLPGSGLAMTVQSAAIFLLLGFGLKSALFPLHQWLPGVYRESPPAVSAFLAATGTKVSLYALARFAFGVLGVAWLQAHAVDIALQALALAAMLIGSTVALSQARLRSLLAWSSIAQIGYLVLGFALLSTAGVAAAMLQLLIHSMVKGGLFLAAGGLSDDRLSALRGLGHRDRLTAVCLSLGALSLLGVPLTAGFIGKWILLQALWADGAMLALLGLALSSALAVVYVGRVVLPLWQAAEGDLPAVAQPLGARCAMVVTAGGSLLFGVYPAPLLALAAAAGAALT